MSIMIASHPHLVAVLLLACACGTCAQFANRIVKISLSGGDCDGSSGENHYGMSGWKWIGNQLTGWGWELAGQLALDSDRRDASSAFAAFHASDPDCRNNNHFLLSPVANGNYKIIQQGGDCDGRSDENHYGMTGWELAGQLALDSDKRDASSAFAAFHAPDPDCRNNNHYRLTPVANGRYKITQQGGDCDGRSDENHYGMTGWELAGQLALDSDKRDANSAFAAFHAVGSDCRNNNYFIIQTVSGKTDYRQTLISARQAQNPACRFEGTYSSEDEHTQIVTFDGMHFHVNQGEFYVDSDNVIHDMNGTTGTFQPNCNVINWSNGGTWIRQQSTFLGLASAQVYSIMQMVV